MIGKTINAVSSIQINPGNMAELADVGGTTYILPSISITKEATTAISAEAANLASGTMLMSGGSAGDSGNNGNIENQSNWNKGSFENTNDSLEYHFNKHGSGVGAKNINQYLKKAEEFSKNLKGATKQSVDGFVDGVTRYIKNGKYIDIAPDGTIISFGKR